MATKQLVGQRVGSRSGSPDAVASQLSLQDRTRPSGTRDRVRVRHAEPASRGGLPVVPALDADYALRAQTRLRHVLSANRSIIGELSLPAVLRRIVHAARDVAGADYAALGIIGAEGSLEEFVHTGMDAGTVAKIGGLPEGRGLLGALITDPQPIRLRTLADDARSTGFPKGHPPMGPFLGVPIRLRNTVFGNLYLTKCVGGDDFSFEDEELVLALAATAGIAIENARLYEQSGRRQDWLQASGEISRELLSAGGNERDVLEHIVANVCELAAADVATLVLPADTAETLEVVVASGMGATELAGLRYPVSGSIAWQAIQRREALMVHDVEHQPGVYVHLRPTVPVSQVMVLPLSGEQHMHGAIVVGRVGNQAPFAQADLDMAKTFAQQAALALELAETRAAQQRLVVLEDRSRIARDLHDHVIQRLFAASLNAQRLAEKTLEPLTQEGLVMVVAEMTDTIRRIRATIFALQDRKSRTSARRTALLVLDQLAPLLGFRPELHMSGPLDTLVDGELNSDIEAVLREALTNVSKHAHAARVDVELRASGEGLLVGVSDDGRGLDDQTRLSGLANLRSRAERRGGRLDTIQRAEGGLSLRWAVPLRT
jgi:signal transduction histidine kinase